MSDRSDDTPKDIHGRVAAEIRAEVARQELPQEVIAARCGRSQAWVSVKLRGKSQLKLSDIALIAGALGVPVSQFLDAAPEPEEPPFRQQQVASAA